MSALARGAGVQLTTDVWHGMHHRAGRLGWVITVVTTVDVARREGAWLMLAPTKADPVARLVHAWFTEYEAHEHDEPAGPEWDELCARIDANRGGLFSG